MSVFSDPNSPSYARLTGAFYLGIAVAGGFSIAYVPSQIIVAGDAAASVANILAKRGLFNSGIAGDVLVMLFEIMATAMLFFMFKPINATLSLAAALARLSMVAVMAAMLFFHVATLGLVDPGNNMASFSAAQRVDLAGLMMMVHDAGVWIWQVFFCLHLVLLGQLVARSGLFPRLLGHAMSIGGFGYLADSIYSFAAPDFTLLGQVRVGLLVLVTLAEISFALWLVIRGPHLRA